MKKIVLISLVSIALTGCGEDKVTKEYLVGDWRCNWEFFERMDSSREESYGDAVESDEYIETLKIVEDKLYQVSDDGKLVFYNFDYMNNNPEHEISDESSKFISLQKFEKINNDQYRYILTEEFKQNSNTTNVIDIRSKEVTTCTRIK